MKSPLCRLTRVPGACRTKPSCTHRVDAVRGLDGRTPTVLQGMRRGDNRRRFVATACCSVLTLAAAVQGEAAGRGPGQPVLTVHTFGDSVLDCARYNAEGLDPGQLLVKNDDRLFPEFKRHDLQSRGPVRLAHRAVDGATVEDLAAQARGLHPREPSVGLLTIGGNDLIRGLASDTGSGMRAFERTLDAFLTRLPIRPMLMASVYDPTFGDDARNFLGVEARVARANHRRVNAIIEALAQRHGRFVDLHAHFLSGDPSWFTRTIEPSLRGASEVRRVFLAAM
ncbi:MAG: GDSL-like lipase/acylhydrolase [Variovorax sp.]|nr:GDSL-like lipase/acylhydrolase [Variovorax sp.]